MNRENTIWLIVFILGILALAGRSFFSEQGMGKSYVNVVDIDRVRITDADGKQRWVSAEEAVEAGETLPAPGSTDRISWQRIDESGYRDYVEAELANPGQTEYRLSFMRSLGVWIAAAMTLFVLSFLIKDNPFYKIAESLFVGISAAYWMVVGFWATIVPNLLAPLAPALVKATVTPDIDNNSPNFWYIIPLILGIMLLWRLAPVGAWISRWPMAFFIGVFCGLRLVTFIHADFLNQINNSIVPLYAVNAATGGFDPWVSLQNVILLIGVLSCLVYFFFSIEHKGAVGATARLGIWFLMVTFGAAFGYTVMGRIALLAIRIEFLLDDWLWIIDPGGVRPV